MSIFLGLVIGIVAGIAGTKYFSNNGETSKSRELKSQLDSLSDENEKLLKRNKEAMMENEDLRAKINQLNRKAKSSESDADELEDELDKLKRNNKTLSYQVDNLNQQLNEYKSACTAYQLEIEQLKDKQS